jgi:hypothetical protein
MEGMKHSYLYGLAVDSGDPQVVMVSASVGPGKAYSIENAESFVYRRDEDGKKWNAVSNGLPRPSGTTITLLAPNLKDKGEFYAANNRGLFRSIDSGISWQEIDIQWPKEYSLQPPWTLAVGS